MERQGSPFLYRDWMEKIIPYHFHTSICPYTTGTDIRPENGFREAFPEKGGLDLILRDYLNLYAFFN
jgi:hypothetical protein